MRLRAERLLFLFAIVLVIINCGCQERPMRRPVSIFDLGNYQQFTEPVTYRPEAQLMVFKDAQGLSFMSTECTYDLALLTLNNPQVFGPATIFSSSFSTSKYGLRGDVLSGPAKFPLPFYRARYAEAILDGPKTSIYVELPGEVAASWRLALP